MRTTPSRHGGHGPLIAMAVILAVAFGLRLYASLFAALPESDFSNDTRAYWRIATNLYEHGTYGWQGSQEFYDYSPGLPLFLTLVLFVTAPIFGPSPAVGMFAVGLLGVLMVWFVYLVGRRAAGPWTGVLAALLAAIYPAFMWFLMRPFTEALGAFFFAASVLAVLWAADAGRRYYAWILPGVLMAATAFTRPEFLPVIVVFAVLVAIRVARDRGRARQGFACAAIFLAAVVVPLAPWMVRSYLVFDRFVPISTGGGKALFIGTMLPAGGTHDGVKMLLAEKLWPPCPKGVLPGPGDRCFDPDEVRRTPPTPLLNAAARGNGYPEVPRDVALGRAGRYNLKRYALRQPVSFAGMMARKAAGMWARGPGQIMHSAGWQAFHLAIVAFAVAGAALLAVRRRWWLLCLFLAAPLVLTLSGAVLLAVPRRTLPVEPVVFVLAATAATALGGWAKALWRERYGGRESGVGRTSGRGSEGGAVTRAEVS